MSDAVLAALCGGAGIFLAKVLDVILARNKNATDQQTATLSRQRELDTVKDNLIVTFQSQIDELRRTIDDLLTKNQELYEDNIALKYRVAGLEYQQKIIRQQTGIEIPDLGFAPQPATNRPIPTPLPTTPTTPPTGETHA